MKYCSKCGQQIHEDAEICVHCGCRVKSGYDFSKSDEIKLFRFLLTFFLGWIGCIVINLTDLKPTGWKCRTLAYLFLGIITFGIYPFVASICNFMFNEDADRNVGWAKE